MQKKLATLAHRAVCLLALVCMNPVAQGDEPNPASVSRGSAMSPSAGVARDNDSVSNALSTYKLGSGDVISIRVFGEDDFTREKIRLNDAGTISFPVLGEVPVNGRTISEIEKLISDRLRGRILVNPRVTAWIEEYRSFYVNGMVERPGAYPYQPGLNVRKAVAIAGGFRERASMNKIFVVREKDAKANQVKVDINGEVFPGDSITVEESFF